MPYTCIKIDAISMDPCGKQFATLRDLEKHVETVHHRKTSVYHKRFQKAVCQRLEEANLIFSEEAHVNAGCVDDGKQRYFVDFWLPRSTYDVMLEVDENQHRFGYGQCQELKRMTDICATYTPRCLWFVRFSPNSAVWQVNKDGEKMTSSGALNQQTRLDALMAKLRDPPDAVRRGDVKLFVTYMFYNWYLDGTLSRPHCLIDTDDLDGLFELVH